MWYQEQPLHERRQVGRADSAPRLVLFGTVLPKFGRLLGKRDERFMLEHIQNTLAARTEEPD